MSTQDATPSKAETRSQAQRERILCAALCCFEKSGFHAASMASIAETSGMSAGLIYRYFDNKDAIILAIIEQQIEIARTRIRALPASHDLVDGFMEHFDEPHCPDGQSMSGALFLEMSAEATRNPTIAAALGRADRAIRVEIADWLGHGEEAANVPKSPAVAREWTLLLFCLVAGLKVLKAREPDLDRDLLRDALEAFTGAMLPKA